ncbi:MAG TPA: antibiotic biosynthesis monooxygenase family protein, partial [Actinomycetes bacterium]|nr:antibiotic biosynthesis monooxygenase family protein [Actinomycetes bacterium]
MIASEGVATTPFLLLTRFAEPDGSADFEAGLRGVAELLGTQPGCVSAAVGRAADDVTAWVLTAQWESVGDYRRAMSSYDVKVAAIAVLSAAVDEPTVFELLYSRFGENVVES